MSSNYYVPLVGEAIGLMDKFTASRQCPDEFLEDVSKDLQSLDPQQRSFILDTISACIEQKQLLDVVVNLFYRCTESVSNSDHSMYLIVCYLTTFCLDQLGLKCYGDIVKSLGVHKVQTFLLFFLSNLTTKVREKWMGIYDAEHVQKQWIEPLLRCCPEIITLLEQQAVKVSRRSLLRKVPAKPTVPQEFALTRPKPRAVIVPKIPELKPRPVPRTTYKAPKEMKIMADIKQKNRQKTENLLYEANQAKRFQAMSPHKSQRYQKVMSEIEESINSKLKFNSFQSTQLPSTTKQSSWDIKLNSAAIFRQEALVNRQRKQELQRTECLVQGAQEPSAFLQWQNEMREKDLQEQLAKVERRRLEGLISLEEAAMARSRLMAQNHAAAKLKKEEAAELMHRYAVRRLQEEKAMRELVQQVSDNHKKAKVAKEKLHAMKRKIVREVSKENQENMRKALAEAEAEMIRKCEIIRQIHAIEYISHTRICSFDDRETAGHELLGEMSLCELRERLASLKEAQLAERQQRQQDIYQQRHRRKQTLQHKLNTIQQHHNALRETTASRKEQTKQKPAVIADESILALQRRLEEKKQERNLLRHKDRNGSGPAHSGPAHSGPAHTGGSFSNEVKLQSSCEQRDWGELEQILAHQIQKQTRVSLM